MKVLVIGGVAAGTKAAAKLKRTDRSAQVTLITKDQHISYAGCGLPYYVGGLIENQEELIVNTPAKYAALTGVEVLTRREAISLNPQTKTVLARNLETEAKEEYSYDACVIAVGASAAVPPVPGTELAGVFTMRTPEDAVNLRAYISAKGAKRALVVGAGFIGLEAAENLKAQHLSVTALELAPQIMPGVLDEEMAAYAKKHLQKMGIRIMTGTSLISLEGEEAVSGAQTSGGRIPADVVVLATGIRPNTDFLKDSGLAMEKGLIVTDEKLRTNLPDVYAAGDCAQVHNRLTGKPQWSPMGSSANYEGRTLAQVIGGNDKTYAGVLGTGVVRLPQLNAGRTGLTEVQAKAEGYDAISALCVTEDKAHYYPDAAFFVTKLVADRGSHRLLGAQVLGPGSVDKMIDIAAVGISMEAALEDFENMDLAYAPPFSTAIHPLSHAVNVLMNKMDGTLETMTPAEYASGAAEGYKVMDVSLKPSIEGAPYVDLTKIEGEVEGFAKDEPILLVCAKGKRGYLTQNRMKYYGYTKTRVLEGGLAFNEVEAE